MALPTRTIRSLFCSLTALLVLTASSVLAQGVLVPAYVFPDPKSDVITYVKVDPEAMESYPRVLDASLAETWYWSTYEGEFVGYVNKREVVSRHQLEEGTLIRTNPTYRSWVLTRYQRGDQVNVRSRLSVGRVSFEKEIPIYFQMPEQPEPVAVPEPEPVNESPAFTEAEGTPPEPSPTAPVPEPVAPTGQEAVPSPSPAEPMEPESRLEPVAESTEVMEPSTPEPESIDPLLEEQPRIPAQDLANLAPLPAADFFQEFEGFLRIVSAEDPMADRFQYQLETRSGQRIVYVQVDQLRRDSYQEYVDEWINIRGTLDEVGEDFTLFIDARSIWVAPTP